MNFYHLPQRENAATGSTGMRAIASKPDESQLGVGRIVLIAWAGVVCIRDVLACAPGFTYSTSLLLSPLWLYRALRSDSRWQQDLFLCLIVDYWSSGGLLFLRPAFYDWLRDTQTQAVPIYSTLLAILLFSIAIVYRGDGSRRITGEISENADQQFLPPLLIPSRTTHTRIFPKKHSFVYSYFYVGIPVGWRGCAGSALSADIDILPGSGGRRGWFNVDASDYLERGPHQKGLEGKLRSYLHSQV